MKLKEQNWIDTNGNTWPINGCNEESALALFKSLKCCTNCNCCVSSDNCNNCDRCVDCNKCHSCASCTGCIECTNCTDCYNCYNCVNCHGCSDCYHCHDYVSQPKIYMTTCARFYYGETTDGEMSLQVVWKSQGTLEEFEQAVMKEFANNEECRNICLKEIAKVKILFDIN